MEGTPKSSHWGIPMTLEPPIWLCHGLSENLWYSQHDHLKMGKTMVISTSNSRLCPSVDKTEPRNSGENKDSWLVVEPYPSEKYE